MALNTDSSPSGELDANPVREVRKPSQRPKRVVRPLSPEQVEAIRAQLQGFVAAFAAFVDEQRRG